MNDEIFTIEEIEKIIDDYFEMMEKEMIIFK